MNQSKNWAPRNEPVDRKELHEGDLKRRFPVTVWYAPRSLRCVRRHLRRDTVYWEILRRRPGPIFDRLFSRLAVSVKSSVAGGRIRFQSPDCCAYLAKAKTFDRRAMVRSRQSNFKEVLFSRNRKTSQVAECSAWRAAMPALDLGGRGRSFAAFEDDTQAVTNNADDFEFAWLAWWQYLHGKIAF